MRPRKLDHLAWIIKSLLYVMLSLEQHEERGQGVLLDFQHASGAELWDFRSHAGSGWGLLN